MNTAKVQRTSTRELIGHVFHLVWAIAERHLTFSLLLVFGLQGLFIYQLFQIRPYITSLTDIIVQTLVGVSCVAMYVGHVGWTWMQIQPETKRFNLSAYSAAHLHGVIIGTISIGLIAFMLSNFSTLGFGTQPWWAVLISLVVYLFFLVAFALFLVMAYGLVYQSDQKLKMCLKRQAQ